MSAHPYDRQISSEGDRNLHELAIDQFTKWWFLWLNLQTLTGGRYSRPFIKLTIKNFASEALFLRWQKIDICTGILVACTATGSAVAGWALWTHPTGATLWAFIAGFAAFGSIVHAAMTVPTRLKEQVTLRGLFSALRVQLETCLNQIIIDVTKDASADYDRLRAKYAEYVGRAAPDIAFTTRLRVRVQNSLDKKIEEYIQ